MAGCLMVLGAMLMPRVLLFIYWIIGSFRDANTWDTWWVPLLGFLFLPATTLVFGFCHVYGGGEFSTWWIVGMTLAVLYDFGVIGGAGKSKGGRKKS